MSKTSNQDHSQSQESLEIDPALLDDMENFEAMQEDEAILESEHAASQSAKSQVQKMQAEEAAPD